jgi:hypothetical protein
MASLTLNPSLWMTLAGGRRSLREPADLRARRVLLLLAGVALLSAGDLAVTLAHMHSIGMFEHNPIVRHLVRATGSGWALVIYKSLTVICALSLLYPLRRRRQGELGAWLGMIMLAGVSVMWWCYARELANLSGAELQGLARLHANWIELHP